MSRDTGFWLQQFLNIIQLASFYVPLATAFALIQGVSKRVFFSLGDVAMYASFAAIYVCFDSMIRGLTDWSGALLALAAGIMCTAALGFVIARLVFGERLIGEGQAFMIASLGLAIALQETMRLQSGSRDVWVPPLFQGETVLQLGGAFPVKITVMAALTAGLSLLAMLLFLYVMRITKFGREWRACEQSIPLARLCGVDTGWLITMTFVLASSLAAIAGWISAISYGGTNFFLGPMIGFKAMFASVLGGFGTLRGAVIGGLMLAAMEVLWQVWFSSTWRDAFVFGVMISVLIIRPEGLTGVASRRESEVQV
jgi:branched-chain amino acid transport system permease protein